MDSFLQQTARSIIETIPWEQLSRTTLVLPSHRAGLVLKDELLRLQQERHAQAVWAPQVQTLPQLQDALSPLYAEDELFTIVRLYQIYRTLETDPSKQMSLDLFYNWGRQMVADFTNIDASMPVGSWIPRQRKGFVRSSIRRLLRLPMTPLGINTSCSGGSCTTCIRPCVNRWRRSRKGTPECANVPSLSIGTMRARKPSWQDGRISSSASIICCRWSGN